MMQPFPSPPVGVGIEASGPLWISKKHRATQRNRAAWATPPRSVSPPAERGQKPKQKPVRRGSWLSGERDDEHPAKRLRATESDRDPTRLGTGGWTTRTDGGAEVPAGGAGDPAPRLECTRTPNDPNPTPTKMDVSGGWTTNPAGRTDEGAELMETEAVDGAADGVARPAVGDREVEEEEERVVAIPSALAEVERLKRDKRELVRHCCAIQRAVNRRRAAHLVEMEKRRRVMEAELSLFDAEMIRIQATASEIDAAVEVRVSHPVEGGVDPTLWLPDEMLLMILQMAPTAALCRAVPLVCKRWHALMQSSPLRARLKWARWELFALGEIRPGHIQISAGDGDGDEAEGRHTEQATTLAVGPRGEIWTAGDDATKVWTQAPPDPPHQSENRGEDGPPARLESAAVESVASMDEDALPVGLESGAIDSIDAPPTAPALAAHPRARAKATAAAAARGGVRYRPVDVLAGHGGAVLALAVGPTGAVISGSADRTAKIWCASASTVGCRGTLTGHGGPVRAVVVCGVNTTVYTASDDCSIVAWRRSGGSFVPQRLLGHTDRINALALGHDGTLYSASDDCTVRVWAGGDGALLRTLTGHSEPVWDVTVGENNEVYTASDDTLIHVWDGASGKHLRVLEGHTGGVHRVVIAKDGAVLSCSDDWPDDPTIRVWHPVTGELLCVIPVTVPVSTAPGGVAPANAIALAPGGDGRIYALSAKAGSLQHVLVF
eukprot:m.23087 g.23087  ORF g.23087 m.23087 type:complete len:722 (-) comp5901_c0_seq1:372-2537(-)